MILSNWNIQQYFTFYVSPKSVTFNWIGIGILFKYWCNYLLVIYLFTLIYFIFTFIFTFLYFDIQWTILFLHFFLFPIFLIKLMNFLFFSFKKIHDYVKIGYNWYEILCDLKKWIPNNTHFCKIFQKCNFLLDWNWIVIYISIESPINFLSIDTHIFTIHFYFFSLLFFYSIKLYYFRYFFLF